MDTDESKIIFEKNSILKDLEAYGESEVAEKYMNIDEETFERISRRASDYSEMSEKPDGPGMLFAKAICLAIVEVIEGKARPLKRSRRRYVKK